MMKTASYVGLFYMFGNCTSYILLKLKTRMASTHVFTLLYSDII